jgi:hypothetical protein
MQSIDLIVLIFSIVRVTLATAELKPSGSKTILRRRRNMNRSSKTRQQLLLEVEELRTRLDVVQQQLQEADEGCRRE